MKKVLIFIDWYTPAYKAGGPVKSVVNLVEALKDKIAFDIVTSDRDFGDTEAFKNIEFNQWILKEKNVRIMYLSHNSIFKKIKNIIRDDKSDYVYLNSLYSIPFSFIPLLLTKFTNHKVILAPRGMLGKGALEIKSNKKKVFLSLFKTLLLDKKIYWQATSNEEKKEINLHFERAKVKLVPNLASVSNNNPLELIKEKNKFRLCFISRISVKKNLFQALEILKELENHADVKCEIVFDIFGPIEDTEYWNRCNEFIQNHAWKNSKINYVGSLLPEQIHPTISNYHFLFLPTLNENFGHIILESLFAGRPIIISDQTPWRNLKELNIGFDFKLSDEKQLIDALLDFVEMDNEQFQNMVRSVNNFVREYNKHSQSLLLSENLFQ